LNRGVWRGLRNLLLKGKKEAGLKDWTKKVGFKKNSKFFLKKGGKGLPIFKGVGDWDWAFNEVLHEGPIFRFGSKLPEWFVKTSFGGDPLWRGV